MTADVDFGTDGSLHRLTPQERECLRLVAGHLSSKEIARRLGISKTSVDTYCDRARQKLGVRGRYEAARLLTAALTDAGPTAAAPSVSLETDTAPWPAARPRRRLALTLLAAIMAPLAVATLLAGLRALREVVPDPYEQPAVQTTARPAHAG
jgi:DNA-binding CsgD family transcriptional regulator